MNYYEQKTDNSHFLRSVLCFNWVRGQTSEYFATTKRIGTYWPANENSSTYAQDITYLDRALKTIPLLSCVRKTVLKNNKHYSGPMDYARHEVTAISVSTTQVPADKAMQALFVARWFLTDATYELNQFIFSIENFDKKRFEKDNKYFVAICFYLMAFRPSTRTVWSREGGRERVISLTPSITNGDGRPFNSSATSLYSVKKFFHGGYEFAQPTIKKQQGYIRDHVMQHTSNLEFTENAVAHTYRGRITSKGNIPIRKKDNSEDVPRFLCNIMAQGEQRKHFLPRSKYCLENFMTIVSNEFVTVTPENTLLVFDRLVEIIKEGRD